MVDARHLGEQFPCLVLIADQPGVLITRNEFPANSMPEFIEHLKKHQATMQFASAGAGSTGHLDAMLLNSALGVKITHVPYRGGGAAMQDIIGGRVDYIVTLTGSAVPLIHGNTVKAIAVLTKERAPMLPNLKSSWEQGFKDLEASTWFGFCVPKGTPEAIVKKLHDATVTAMEDKTVQEQMLRAGAVVVAPERPTMQTNSFSRIDRLISRRTSTFPLGDFARPLREKLLPTPVRWRRPIANPLSSSRPGAPNRVQRWP